MMLEKPKYLCLSCHSDVEAHLRSEMPHYPAEEGMCLDCHAPHFSQTAKLTQPAVPDQCLACHDGEDKAFRAKHFDMAGAELVCTDCHNPHSSESDGLFSRNVHAPFGEGECGVCHEAEGKKRKGSE
jgi:predicted CXXCH cytochrome family protein